MAQKRRLQYSLCIDWNQLTCASGAFLWIYVTELSKMQQDITQAIATDFQPIDSIKSIYSYLYKCLLTLMLTMNTYSYSALVQHSALL